MTESIFKESDQTQVVETQNPPSQTVIPQEIAEFVGEGKKYKTVDDALKSVPHAQKHIETIEAELATVKGQLEKSKTAEQLLEEIKSNMQLAETPSTVPTLDPSKVEEIVNSTLVRKEKETIAKTNISTVAETFKANYGAEAEAVYNKLALDSGLNVQQLNQLAATSPSAVIKLAGLTKVEVIKKPNSSVNTESFSSQQNKPLISAKIDKDGSTKSLVDAWHRAGEKVKQTV